MSVELQPLPSLHDDAGHSATSTRLVRRLSRVSLCLATLMPFGTLCAQGESEILSNASIVQMVTGKLPKNLIVSKISASRPGELCTSSV